MKNWGIIVLFLVATMLSSCIESDYTTDPNHRLTFSTDTLAFDTVFNTVAQPTSVFMVYNNNKKALKINTIKLAGGNNSYFRINVDGLVDNENYFTDIEVGGNDSLYVFVALTINEQNDDAPVLIQDAVLFETNGTTQRVNLMAYGQNVTVFDSKTFDTNTTLTAERPYLIYNYLHVANGSTLTLKEGVRLHFHNKANLIVDGNLVAEGTAENPVTMQGDRLDRMADVDKTPYAYLSGQWGNVYLQSPDGQHSLKNVSITGGTNGILLFGNSSQQPTLNIENSRIHMMAENGIYSQCGNLEIVNSELSNCGTSCLNIIGGTNRITHCTIANYYEWAVRETPAVQISNYLIDGNWLYLYELQSAVFQNSIVFGNQSKELLLNRDTISQQSNNFNIYFCDCHIRAPKIDSPQFKNIIWATGENNAEVFVNTSIDDIEAKGYYNFSLISTAASRNKANKQIAHQYPTDKNGYNRFADGKPDMGAYEWHQ